MDVSRTNSLFIIILMAIGLHLPATLLAESRTQPHLTLAGTYSVDIDLSKYWISEKLDGVRAYWDGKKLISRGGIIYAAPTWFIADFPQVHLDGELWLGRSQFELLISIVKDHVPDEEAWKNVTYRVFDLPAEPGNFDHRLEKLQQLFSQRPAAFAKIVPQFKLPNHKALLNKLNSVTQQGGEGLMLHLGSAHYRSGRNKDVLKLKPYQDAEAIILGYTQGKGKYIGLLGALEVKTPEGIRFRIGTGFSDKERNNPPPIGSTITYKYHGVTRKGIPRFASYLRIRQTE